MYKRLISLISISSLLTTQMLPCLAQSVPSATMPTHPWTPSVMPTYQHVWQPQSVNSHTNSSSQTTGLLFFHHWLGASINNTSSNSSGGQSKSTSHYAHTLASSGTTGNGHSWHTGTNSNNTNSSNVHSAFSSSSFKHVWLSNHSFQIWSNLSTNNSSSAKSLILDLSSSSATMTVGHLLHGNTVTINVGSTSLVVNAKTELTPAEYLAVMQVMSGEQQSLVIDAQGSASGGSVVIGSRLSSQLSSLVIPQGVTVIDLSRSDTLNLTGNITDDGNLYVTSRNPMLSAITVNANSINVESQGLISDVIPSGTLSWINNINLNLNLNAVNNITNVGTISSGGALSLNAGGAITNALPSGTTGATPTIQATNNVNLTAGSGNITNAGLIQSTTGNINITSSNAANDININTTGGTFQALNGNINIRDASYTGAANVNLTNGNFLSEEFNIYSGTGAVTADIGLVTGILSTYAGDAHMVVDTPLLIIGNSCVTGDPLYAVLGSVELDGAFTTNGNNLAVIAEGNITSGTAGNVVSINTVLGTVGGSLWLIAGADITVVSPGGGSSSPISNSTSSITSVSFQFDSTQGGNIDFTPASASTVITTGSGNVTLLANSKNSTTGNIWFPTGSTSISAINSVSGDGGGAVLIVAGGTGGTSISDGMISSAIQLGQVQTGGNTTTATGTVQIAAATPSITSGSSASFTNPSNSATTSATFGYGTITPTGAITVGNIITVGYGGMASTGGSGTGANGAPGTSITIAGGGNITTGNLLSYGGGGGGGSDVSGNGGSGGAAGVISVTSNSGNIDVTGEINTSGGGGGGANGGGTPGSGGSQANITLAASSGSVTVTGNIFSYAGGAGGTGSGGNGGGGGGSFGGGGGGSTATGGGSGDVGGGGGAGAAGGGGGFNGNYLGGGGGGFGGGGSSVESDGSAATNLTYGTGTTGNGGTGANAGISGNGGTGSISLADGGGGGGNGQNAGGGSTTGGTLYVNYSSSYSLQTTTVGNLVLNGGSGGGGGGGGYQPTPAQQAQANTLANFLFSILSLEILEVAGIGLYGSTLSISTINNQLSTLYQIGTRIATDYTPMQITYPIAPPPTLSTSDADQIVDEDPDAAANQMDKFINELSLDFVEIYDLQQGATLAASSSADPIINTKVASTTVPPGAAAIVTARGEDTFVYDLHDDRHTGPVKVAVNKQVLTLSPGTALVLTRNTNASFESLYPSKRLGYRNVRSKDIGEGMKAYIYDFSIGEAFRLPKVRDMLKSNDPAQKKIARNIMKDTIILADLTGGAYTYTYNKAKQ